MIFCYHSPKRFSEKSKLWVICIGDPQSSGRIHHPQRPWSTRQHVALNKREKARKAWAQGKGMCRESKTQKAGRTQGCRHTAGHMGDFRASNLLDSENYWGGYLVNRLLGIYPGNSNSINLYWVPRNCFKRFSRWSLSSRSPGKRFFLIVVESGSPDQICNSGGKMDLEEEPKDPQKSAERLL